jgi:hypothetical protein
MVTRELPFVPGSTRSLELGDLIAVPCEPSGWTCLQVVDLTQEGPGARTAFVAGVLPWAGDLPPTAESVDGLAAAEQGLVHVDLFKKGGLQVVDSAPVVPSGLPSNFRDFGMGTTSSVWGWRVAIRRAQAQANARG